MLTIIKIQKIMEMLTWRFDQGNVTNFSPVEFHIHDTNRWCIPSSSNNPGMMVAWCKIGSRPRKYRCQTHQQKRNARRGTPWKEILNSISTAKSPQRKPLPLNPHQYFLEPPLTFVLRLYASWVTIFMSEFKPMINRLKQLTGAYLLRARLPRCTDWIHTASGPGEEGNSWRRSWGNGDNRRNWTSEFRAWLSRCADRIHASFFHCRSHDRNIHESWSTVSEVWCDSLRRDNDREGRRVWSASVIIC